MQRKGKMSRLWCRVNLKASAVNLRQRKMHCFSGRIIWNLHSIFHYYKMHSFTIIKLNASVSNCFLWQTHRAPELHYTNFFSKWKATTWFYCDTKEYNFIIDQQKKCFDRNFERFAYLPTKLSAQNIAVLLLWLKCSLFCTVLISINSCLFDVHIIQQDFFFRFPA